MKRVGTDYPGTKGHERLDADIDRSLEGHSTSIAHRIGGKVMHPRPHHSGPDKYPSFPRGHVHVDVSAGQEPALAFEKRARRRDIEDSDLPASSQADTRQEIASIWNTS